MKKAADIETVTLRICSPERLLPLAISQAAKAINIIVLVYLRLGGPASNGRNGATY